MPGGWGTTPTSRSLGNIDGFLASLTFIDKTHSLPEPIQSQAQELGWSAVQGIRQHLEGSPVPAIESDLRLFTDVRRLYQYGVFAFRNTLTGPTPRKLPQVFALCSLSHAISCILNQMGKLDQHEILEGVVIWRDVLESEAERQTFSRLAGELWPEAHQHLQSPTPLVNDHPSNLEVWLNLDSMQHFVPGWPITEGFDLPNLASHPPDSLFPGLLPVIPPQPTSVSANPNQGGGGAFAIDSGVLRNTAVFTNIARFLEEYGDLMYNLSGHGATAKSFDECSAFNQEGWEDKRQIKDSFFQPLQSRNDLPDVPFQSILSIAEMFVDRGHLQSLTEVRDYLMIMGKEILGGGEVHHQFCQLILGVPARSDMPTTTADGAHASRTLTTRPAPQRKIFACATCGREFNRGFNLRRHETSKHGPSTPGVNLVLANAA
ncbi:hypothetical protein ACJZ2D_013868 [Fusarium nematophilum]